MAVLFLLALAAIAYLVVKNPFGTTTIQSGPSAPVPAVRPAPAATGPRQGEQATPGTVADLLKWADEKDEFFAGVGMAAGSSNVEIDVTMPDGARPLNIGVLRQWIASHPEYPIEEVLAIAGRFGRS